VIVLLFVVEMLFSSAKCLIPDMQGIVAYGCRLSF